MPHFAFPMSTGFAPSGSLKLLGAIKRAGTPTALPLPASAVACASLRGATRIACTYDFVLALVAGADGTHALRWQRVGDAAAPEAAAAECGSVRVP